jgi:SSS family solute:Na+ symporter
LIPPHSGHSQNLLPNGLIGLVLAGLFAHTMAMTSSDANAVSAVAARDILPVMRRGRRALDPRSELFAGRLATFLFLALSMGLGVIADRFDGVMGLILLWFAALVGPIAVPMLLRLLPAFRQCGPAAAITSVGAGAFAFILVKFVFADAIAGSAWATTLVVAAPVVASFLVFVCVGLVERSRDPRAAELLSRLSDHAPMAATSSSFSPGSLS